ncbi:NTP transferase domain-containing protein [Mucilaginibacter litoreus]|uniref:Probable molybdenum cofactor guanylyltransferase n=1 Tax=Mucilaginibacter litoreus TaxID=1048221 RepID=A0ABW3ATA0_9SPHI
MNENKNHAAITRPLIGNFARNEWSIVGGPCTVIKFLAGQIIKALSPKYKCAYADSSHSDDITQLPGRLADNAYLEYTDQINYSQLNYNEPLTVFKQRELFNNADLVLVNGNHQQAKAQVVIVDLNKRASLQKRVQELTNVQLFLLADNTDDLFDFIKEYITNWQEIPVMRLNDDVPAIVSFFESKLKDTKPVLNGLVLAGGKSERMGVDKGAINWHGKEQRYFMADMLTSYCNEVYISCRDEAQLSQIDTAYQTLTDTFTGLGPFGAILTAFRHQPDSAWLVVACDLPLVDKQILDSLTNNRNTAYMATAFKSNYNDFPEPLITIYETKSYLTLLQFLRQGYSCPRKALINNEINLLPTPANDALANVNTPEDKERIRQYFTIKNNAS